MLNVFGLFLIALKTHFVCTRQTGVTLVAAGEHVSPSWDNKQVIYQTTQVPSRTQENTFVINADSSNEKTKTQREIVRLIHREALQFPVHFNESMRNNEFLNVTLEKYDLTLYSSDFTRYISDSGLSNHRSRRQEAALAEKENTDETAAIPSEKYSDINDLLDAIGSPSSSDSDDVYTADGTAPFTHGSGSGQLCRSWVSASCVAHAVDTCS